MDCMNYNLAKNRITFSEATRILKNFANSFKKKLKIRNIDVKNSFGYRCCCDKFSNINIPKYDKSAMDGYAVSSMNDEKLYKVCETIPAGVKSDFFLTDNFAIKVMTGSYVPIGTERVIPIENVIIINNFIKINIKSNKRNIIYKSEISSVNDLVLRAGATIGSIEIGKLLLSGISNIDVFEKINVSIISTGNEITNILSSPSDSMILDSNGPMLTSLCNEIGLNIVNNFLCSDNKELIKKAIFESNKSSDIIITTGGASVGDYDYIKEIIYKIGYFYNFGGIMIKPGKPTIFSMNKKNQIIFCLPGNPVSALLSFHLFVKEFISSLFMDYNEMGDAKNFLKIRKSIKSKNSSFREYFPCNIDEDFFIEPYIGYRGSADLISISRCSGFFVFEKDRLIIEAGEKVEYIPINNNPALK